jgi:hypothetical protein
MRNFKDVLIEIWLVETTFMTSSDGAMQNFRGVLITIGCVETTFMTSFLGIKKYEKTIFKL